MRVAIYYHGKLIYTVVVAHSVTDPMKAVALVKNGLQVLPELTIDDVREVGQADPFAYADAAAGEDE